MRCAQPDCPGEIVDGYCDTCGMPPDAAPIAPEARVAPATPAPAPSASAPARPAPSASTASSGCQQPGCGGTIVDGYCDTCGAPAGSAPLAPAKPSTAPHAAAANQAMTAATSATIGATVLGSARAGGNTRRTLTTRLRQHRIGAGLTTVPPAPSVDPSTVLMVDPAVPENKRNCPNCGKPVGRGHDEGSGRQKGFCPHCGAAFNFEAKLKAGDVVAGQYEVQGALAHGGMGWIYLARDRNVSNRWVVLKGLLNSEDPDLVAATLSEQQFLATVSHPLLVEIYNFVEHDGSAYIVMEYVGGRSLKDLLKQRMEANHGTYDPLPVDQALAFIIEILPAFQYLHDQGLVYCDFKPDNVIQTGDSLKLIDLGGVRRVDDEDSAIYGTVGYQAPEVATAGPSIASDLYTIGRSLLVLCAEFRGYQSTFEFSIPTPAELPLFAEHDSLYRLILKCCAPDPQDRFTSADELRNQMMGVLREEVAAKTPGHASSSTASLLFDPPTIAADTFEWFQLPQLRVDPTDQAYGFLGGLDISDPLARLNALDKAPVQTPEVDIARAHAALEAERHDIVRDVTNRMLALDPWEWRAVWMAGLDALQRGEWKSAQASFNAVYGQVPGELAPKLALAVACEMGGETAVAENLYLVCASTDANYVTGAAFGLARIRVRTGNLPGALAALDMISTTNRGYAESRRLRTEHLVARGQTIEDMALAMRSVMSARLEDETRDRNRVEILERATAIVASQGPRPDLRIGDAPATVAGLRLALEQAYRDAARHPAREAERTDLLDRANRIRPWSLL